MNKKDKGEGKPTTALSFFIPTTLHEAVKKQAKAAGVTMRAWYQAAFEEKVKAAREAQKAARAAAKAGK